MCGIVGIASQNRISESIISKFTDAVEKLEHRGPDGQGIHVTPNVLLGHRRLSIIDLEGGAQPMSSEDKRYTISFDGQIYNYKDIQAELIQLGHRFQTNSDTEVLLKSYIQWGASCLEKLNGMFAFAILDSHTNDVFLARDRFGIKPLFYTVVDECLIFASEIKAIYNTGLASFQPNAQHFNEFLIWGYVAGEETLHRDVLSLEQAHFMVWSNGKLNIKRYWYPVNPDLEVPDNEEELVDALEEKVKQAVDSWLVSDVEVGCLLSGGVDSSTVTALASKHYKGIKAFTAHFPEQPEADERPLARQVTDKYGCTPIDLPLIDTDITERLETLIAHYEYPLHAPNYITLMMLCEQIKSKSDIKVVLCGEGSDEIFAGYGRYRPVAEEYVSKGNDQDTLVYAMNKVALPRLELFASTTEIANKRRWEIEEACLSKEPITRFLELDLQTFMVPYLHRQDRISMMYGLESRTPFLDHNLVEFANAIPDHYKVRRDEGDPSHFWNKYIMRRVAERHVPKSVIWNRKKYQFQAPVSKSFENGELNKYFKDLFGSDCRLAEYYSREGMLKLLSMHDSTATSGDKGDHSNTLWRLLNLEIWLRLFG